MSLKAWEFFFKFHHIFGLVLVALAGAALYLNQEITYWSIERKVMTEEQPKDQCDIFSGRWVYDNVSYPLYKEEQCSFIEDMFACEKNGRKDFNYRHWRWQPHHCDIPKFNGKAFLEKIRGKKLLFVGDSLNRNQWVSLLCLIESSLPPSSNNSLTLIGNCKSLHSIEYNTTIGFYWSPFLVESNCDTYYSHHHKEQRVVNIESIEKHGRHWNDADILIFDSYAWWLSPDIRLLWGSFDSPDAIYKRLGSKRRPLEMAIRTWSDWLEMNINRTKTKLFFMSASPHSRSDYTNGHCYDRSVADYDKYKVMGVLESTIENLRTRGINVEFVRITRMSENRSDAHPSMFRTYKSHLDKNPVKVTDCLHWCLPGVPDAWNQILYDYIMKS